MSYDFSKLSRVPITNSVTDETFSLVVNQDEVERTQHGNVINNIKDYTSDYNDYVNSHPDTTPIDYIRTLYPITTDTNTPPRHGYITDELHFYYEFEVFFNAHFTWYKIIEVDAEKQEVTEYLYDPSNLVEKIQKKYSLNTSENGTHFITPVKFEDVTILNDLNVGRNLYVEGNSILKNIEAETIKIKSSQDNEIVSDGTNITIKNTVNGKQVVIGEDNSGNVFFSDGENDSEIKLTNVALPEEPLDAANKQYVDEQDELLKEYVDEQDRHIKDYVDTQDNSIRDELISRINSFLSSASANGEMCTIAKVMFEYDEDTGDFICHDNGEGIGTTVLNPSTTELSYTFNPSGGPLKIDFLTAYYNLYTDPVDIYYDFSTLTYGPSSVDEYEISATINVAAGPASGIRKVWFVYLKATSELNIQELVDLRLPFDYSESINNYSTSENYTTGDYCYYPDSTTGRLYICITDTSGEWSEESWLPVYARDSIDKAFNNRVKRSGDSMTGELSMGNNRIMDLGIPVNKKDAVTKEYVDDISFTLDENDLLCISI
jgi:hypothetical protein